VDVSRGRWLWLAATLLVLAGWGAGYLFWDPDSPGEEFVSYFDLFTPAVTVLLGGPLAVSAGLLLGGGGRGSRLAGYAALGATCLVLVFLVAFSFFGGFCLDPGDVCVTSWLSRTAELTVAIACLVGGWLAHQRRVHRRAATRSLTPRS